MGHKHICGSFACIPPIWHHRYCGVFWPIHWSHCDWMSMQPRTCPIATPENDPHLLGQRKGFRHRNSCPATAKVEMAATAGTGGEGRLDATSSKICKKSSTHGMSINYNMLQVSYYYHDNDDDAPAARDTTSRRTQSRVSQLSTYRAIYICACISVSVSVSVPFPLSFFHEIALEIPDQEDAHIWQHATDPDHIGFRVPDADAPLRPLHQTQVITV